MNTNTNELLSKYFEEKQIKNIDSFFNSILDALNNYDYLVLTTRRCFCLINCLMSIYKPKKDLDYNKIISSQAINIYGNKLKGKKILLCDDIMIHGQSVYRLYKLIKTYCPDELDVLLMLRNIEKPDYFKIKASHNYKTISYVSYTDWRRFSNNIVRFIHSTECLYVSYVYGYRMPQNKCYELVSSKNKFKKLSLKNNLFAHEYYYDDTHEPEYYIINDFKKSFNNIFKFNYVNYATFRIYQIPNTSECWVVPYFELKDLSCQQLEGTFKQFEQQNELFKMISDPCDRYKALTAIVSILMSKELFPEIEFNQYTRYIDKSFFEDFHDCVIKLNPQEIFEILEKNINCNISWTPSIEEQNSIIYSNLTKSFNDSQSEIELEFKKYFAIINKEEEESYRELAKLSIQTSYFNDHVTGNQKFIPIRITDFQEKVLSNYALDDYIKNVLYFMDSGAISLISQTFGNEEKYVGAFAKAGEQSYHLFADIAGVYFTAFYFVYSFINEHIKDVNKQKAFIKAFIETIDKSYSNYLDSTVFRFLFDVNFKSLESYYFGLKNAKTKEYIKKKSVDDKLKLVCEIIKNHKM